MVFENVFANLLNTYLSTFIDDVSSNQLQLGAWKGKLELKNLSVKENALDSLDLPFKVVHGRIGVLSASIPWASLYTSPVILNLSDVYVIAVPNVESTFDPEKEAKQAEAAKQKVLESIEEAVRRTKEAENPKKTNDDFVTKLAAQIVKNVQVRVTNVHVSYEDKFTNPMKPFIAGLTLDRMVFETQDKATKSESKYSPTNPEEVIYKLVSLEKLAIYWNVISQFREAVTFISNQDIQFRDELLHDAIATATHRPRHLNYVLEPITFTANAIINRKPEDDDFQIPLLDLGVVLDSFYLQFNRTQFESLLLLLDSIGRMRMAQPYRRWRPSSSIKGHARVWWTFAISAIVEREIRPKAVEWSWSNIKRSVERRREYQVAYVDKLSNPKNKKVAELVAELEKELDVFNIVLARRQADTEMKAKKIAMPEKKDGGGGWFSWAWGGNKNGGEDDVDSSKVIVDIKKEITPDEKEKLYEAIGYGNSSLVADFPSDFAAHLLNVNLDLIRLVINDDIKSQKLIDVSLTRVFADIKHRPSSGGIILDSSIGKLSVIGVDNRPLLREESEGNILSVKVEVNLTEREYDYGLDVQAKGLRFVYDPITVQAVLEMVSPPEDVSFRQLEQLAELKLSEWKKMSATGLEYAVSLHKDVMVNIDIEPSYLVVPGGNIWDANVLCDALILCSGHGKITSDLVKRTPLVSELSKSETQEAIIDKVRASAYEDYKLSLSSVQAILSDSRKWVEDIKAIGRGGENNVERLLKPINLDTLFQRSIIIDDPSLPKFKVEGQVPQIFLQATDEQIVRTLTILTKLSPPEKDALNDIEVGLDVAAVAVLEENKLMTEAAAASDAIEVARQNSTDSDDETDSNKNPRAVDVVAKFSIKEVVCELRSKDSLVLRLAIEDFGSAAIKERFGLKVSAHLGKISIYAPGQAGEVTHFFETPRNEHLLRMSFEMIDQKSPHFDDVLQIARLDISDMTCNLDHQAIGNILAWAEAITKRLPKAEEEVKPRKRRESGTSMSSLGLGLAMKGSRPGTGRKRTKRAELVKLVAIKVALNLESVTINIKDICSVGLNGFQCDLNVFQSSRIGVSAKWDKFVVLNSIIDSRQLVYKEIVKSESDSVLKLDLVLFTPEEVAAGHSETDIAVSVTFGRLKVVFLNEFVSKLLKFLANFEEAKQRALEATYAAAEAAKASAKSAYESCTKIGLNVSLEAPHVIVPRNWESGHCLLIDLGKMNLSNVLKTRQKATLDNITLELNSTQISVVNLFDTADQPVNHILRPISFSISVVRNLTFNSVKSFPEIQLAGVLKGVELNLSQFDIQLMLAILGENVSAGAAAVEPSSAGTVRPVSPTGSNDGRVPERPGWLPLVPIIVEEHEVEVHVDAEQLPAPVAKPSKRLKFELSLPDIRLTLFDGLDKSAEQKLSVAEIIGLETFGEIMTDDSLSANFNLQDVLLYDGRPGSSSNPDGIHKFMFAKLDPSDKDFGKIIRVEVTMDKNLVFVNANMTGFTLIFALDYLLKVSDVMLAGLSGGSDQVTKDKNGSAKSVARPTVSSSVEAETEDLRPVPSDSTENGLQVTANFRMSKVDVVLLESILSIDCPSVIFNSDANLDVQLVGPKIAARGSVSTIQLAMTNYKRYSSDEDIDAYILQPCKMDFQASLDTEQGTKKVSVIMSRIQMNISPNTVQVLVSILSAIGSESQTEAERRGTVSRVTASQLFTPEKIDASDDKLWFLKSGVAEATEVTEDMVLIGPDTPSDGAPTPGLLSKEQVFLQMDDITVVVESGGLASQPMIKLESSLDVRFDDWTKLSANTSLLMSYYNERLIAWEPVIEPVEEVSRIKNKSSSSKPWSCAIGMTLNPKQDFNKVVATVESAEQLELTVSKTFLNVLTQLGDTFSKAIKEAEHLRQESSAVSVRNFIGLDIVVFVDRTNYEVAEGLTDRKVDNYEGVVVTNGSVVTLKRRDQLKVDDDGSSKLLVNIVVDGKELTRPVSLARQCRRAYDIPVAAYPSPRMSWLLDVVSLDIKSKQVTFGTLVEVENYLDIAVHLYTLVTQEDVGFLKSLEPKATWFLPLNVVHSALPTILVKPASEDVCIPNQGVSWSESHDHDETNVVKKFTVVCDSKVAGRPPVYLQVATVSSSTLYEDTSKSSAVTHKIIVNPPMSLQNCLPLPISYRIGDQEEVSYLNTGHTAQLVTFDPNGCTLELRLDHYLEHNWSCKKRLTVKKLEEDEVIIWTFEADQGVATRAGHSANNSSSRSSPVSKQVQSLSLAISFSRSSNRSVTASVYSTFWLVNKTGLEVTYKVGSDLQMTQAAVSGFPLLISFKSGSFAKKKLCLTIGSSSWSDSFSIDAVGNKGNVVCKAKDADGSKINYCASIDISLSSFNLTKIVTVRPFYIIVNRTNEEVDMSEDTQSWTRLGAHAQQSLWPKNPSQCNLYFRTLQGGAVSPPIRFKEPCQSLVALGDNLFNVLVDVNDTEVRIQISDYWPGSAPVRIFNATDSVLKYEQRGTRTVQELGPQNAVYYTWTEPSGHQELVLKNNLNGSNFSEEKTIDLTHDAFGDLVESQLFWVSFLDGKQRTLVVTDEPELTTQALQAAEFTKPKMTLDICMKGFGLSLVNDDARKELIFMGIRSSEIMWEIRKPKSKRYKALSLKMSDVLEATYQREELKRKYEEDTGSLGKPVAGPRVVSLSNGMKVDLQELDRIVMLEPQRGTLRRTSAPGFWAMISMSDHIVQVHAKVNRVQVDNQMEGCLFPIIMCPVTPPKSLALDRAPKAFFEVSTVIQRTANVVRVKYLSVLIQEFLVQIDGQFLMSLLEFAGSTVTSKVLDYPALIRSDLDSATTDETFADTDELILQKNFYDLIHLAPIKVHVSFSLGGVSSWEIFGVFDILLRSAGVTLTEFRDVLFKIDYFERKNCLFDNGELISAATNHYVRQVLKQFYVIVLGLDVIGNPVGLVMGLKSGVGDLFYEPFLGMIEGPEEFAEGLALGVRSLFSSTVGGAAGALSKITGTLGEGVSALTMDDEYIKRRRARMNQQKTNIASSGKELARGFFSGLAGLVTKPIQGAKEDGFEGLVKGLGKGAVGVIAQPATGVIDFASGSLGALKKAVDIGTETKKQRPPRAFYVDNVLRPYNRHEAVGNQVLRGVDKGAFSKSDNYVVHVRLRHPANGSGDVLVMVTNRRLMILKLACLSKNWDLDWQSPFENIASFEVERESVIRITLKENQKILCVINDGNEKLIFFESGDRANSFYQQVIKAKSVDNI